MISEIEDYFLKGCGRCKRFGTPDCSVQRWAAGLDRLRRICIDSGLTETVKWGHPCYMHAGRNIAIIGAFRDDFRLSFLNAALLRDPDGVLERRGPNTRTPDMFRFDNAGQVAVSAPVIRSYLSEAMGYAETGVTAPKAETAIELPEELVAVMDADPELAEAFHSLSPGRQRSHVLHLESTRTPATRFARIEKCRPKILAGKGANER
ncbi:MAG: YdeI/OmpD-associated family protein [Pseudorhodobacter sp.]